MTWTSKQKQNAMLYGVCRTCGSPREVELKRDSKETSTAIVCPKGHPQ